MNPVDEPAVPVVKLYRPDSVSSVPQAIVSFGPVRRLIIHKEHVLLPADNIGNHPSGRTRLLHVPDNLRVSFLARELRMDPGPHLGEIKLVRSAFIPKGRKELARECYGAHFRTSSPDIEDAVHEFLSRNLTGKVV